MEEKKAMAKEESSIIIIDFSSTGSRKAPASGKHQCFERCYRDAQG